MVVDVGVCVEGGAAAGWSYAEVDEWGGKAGIEEGFLTELTCSFFVRKKWRPGGRYGLENDWIDWVDWIDGRGEVCGD